MYSNESNCSLIKHESYDKALLLIAERQIG